MFKEKTISVMIYNEKKITKLTMETGDVTVSWEVPYNDTNMEQLLTAFYSLCIGQTYSPSTVLGCMKDFAEEHQPPSDSPEWEK